MYCTLSTAVQLACLGQNFVVFFIPFEICKTIDFIWMNLSVFNQIYQLFLWLSGWSIAFSSAKVVGSIPREHMY